MFKRASTLMAAAAICAVAGPQNAITLTDLKEATYKLILDMRQQKAVSAEMDRGFSAKLEALKGEIEKVREGDRKEIEMLSQKLKDLRMQYKIKEGDDRLDRIIASFVDRNRQLLPSGDK